MGDAVQTSHPGLLQLVGSGVAAVYLANYPLRCGAGSSGRGKSPDEVSLAALPAPRPLIAGRVPHSALTLAQKSARFIDVLARGSNGRGPHMPDEENDFGRRFDGRAFGVGRAVKISAAF